MPRLPVLALLPPVVFVGLAVLFFAGMQREDPDALPSTFEGERAPDLTLTPLGDRAVFERAVLDEPGVKLVNFWASWCAPCRVEHPNLQALADEAGVPIYGINYKDEQPNALRFLADLGDPYVATAADDAGRTARDWGVYGVPETFVVDSEGRVVARVAGPVTERTLDRTIRPALEEARDEPSS